MLAKLSVDMTNFAHQNLFFTFLIMNLLLQHIINSNNPLFLLQNPLVFVIGRQQLFLEPLDLQLSLIVLGLPLFHNLHR